MSHWLTTPAGGPVFAAGGRPILSPSAPALLSGLAIVAESALTRECLTHVLAASGIAADCRAVARVADLAEPAELAILDLGGRGFDQDHISRALSEIHTRTSCRALVLLGGPDPDPDLAGRLQRLPIEGYIPSSFAAEIVLATIQLIALGGSFLPNGGGAPRTVPPALASGRTAIAATDHGCHECLTARETEVVAHLREGQQNKRIAYEMCISESTVKVHIRNIMRKFNLKNRTQVALLDLADHARELRDGNLPWATKPSKWGNRSTAS